MIPFTGVVEDALILLGALVRRPQQCLIVESH